MSFKGLPKKVIRNLQKEIRHLNSKYSSELVEVPVEMAKAAPKEFTRPVKVYRSDRFIVQIFNHEGYTRVSVNRTMINDYGEFLDGITWDDLFRIKNEIGFADNDAVEVYPAQTDLTNVANIRHLWILKEGDAPFIWRNK